MKNIGNICKEKENVEKNVKRGGNYIALLLIIDQIIKENNKQVSFTIF